MQARIWAQGPMDETQNDAPIMTLRAEVIGRRTPDPNCLFALYYDEQGACVMQGYLGQGSRIYTSGRWWDALK